jgi:adenylate cyclase
MLSHLTWQLQPKSYIFRFNSLKSLLKILLFLILPFVVTAQSPMTTLDSLHLSLRGATDDTMRLIAVDRLQHYYDEVNWDSSLYYDEIELSLARKMKFDLEQADLLRIKGYVLMKLGNYPESMEAFLQAIKIAENPENEKNIFDLPKDQTGRFYRLNLLANVYHEYGHLYVNTGNPRKAISIYLESKRIAESVNNTSVPAFVYMNLGLSYILLNQLDSALWAEEKALALFTNTTSLQRNVYKAAVLIRMGIIYKKMGKNDISRDYFYKANQIGKEQNGLVFLAESYLYLSDLCLTDKQFDSCIIYAKKCLQLHRSVRDPLNIADAYTYISLAYKGENKIDSACTYMNLSSTLRDSLYKIRIQKLTEFQNVGFKEQLRIEELEKEKIQLQGRIRTYGLAAGISVFVIIVIFLYHKNKEKQKANRALEEKNIVISNEKSRSEELLLNILPAEVANELKQTGHCVAKTFSMVTVMFMDFKDFTIVSERVSAELLVDEINTCFSTFDNIVQKYNVEKIKTVGDSYLCVGGLPVLNQTHAKDIILAAIEIQGFMRARKKEKEDKEEFAFDMRIGIHTGPVVTGIVGVRKFQYDIWGDTVNVAARMEQNSEAGRINISGSTYKLIKDKFNCVYRGKIEVKNKGEVEMYFIESLRLSSS